MHRTYEKTMTYKVANSIHSWLGAGARRVPNGQSETVYRRRTDNTMTKGKRTKGTNNDQQNIHIKIYKHKPH